MMLVPIIYSQSHMAMLPIKENEVQNCGLKSDQLIDYRPPWRNQILIKA
jgi:hypothetical protein